MLYEESDFWQHPVKFEEMRQGDCEDHALWAWRKLAEIDIPAEMMETYHPWYSVDHQFRTYRFTPYTEA